MNPKERARRAAARSAFVSEGALCDAFAAQARREGYVVHAECCGWDLLLVDPEGTQVGVQAKLRSNVDVLAQAVGTVTTSGPDHHAVLVPVPSPAFLFVARALRILVFDAKVFDGYIRVGVENAIHWEHVDRAWTPPVEVPGFGGGRSGPRQLTPWKFAACRLCALLRRRGYLTRADFRAERLSPAWWTDVPRGGQPVLRAERVGKAWRYVAGGGQLPDERWPEVAIALANEQDGVPRRKRT